MFKKNQGSENCRIVHSTGMRLASVEWGWDNGTRMRLASVKWDWGNGETWISRMELRQWYNNETWISRMGLRLWGTMRLASVEQSWDKNHYKLYWVVYKLIIIAFTSGISRAQVNIDTYK